MIRQLHISNLAIIEKVDIEFAPGLNVFTGQTGAGKSLILGALQLLLGLRGGGGDTAMFVRPGSDEARVSGVFEMDSPELAQRLAGILDQPIAVGEPLLITRRVGASGRSSVSVNGLPVTAAMLREAGQYLVEIHGQHDQQFLLRSANQLLVLDSFAQAGELRAEFAQAWRQLRESQRRMEELRASQEQRDSLIDLYRFQIEEIDQAGLTPGEYASLRNRHSVLKNRAHLKEQAGVIFDGLSEAEGSVLDRLGTLSHALRQLARTDASLVPLAQQMEEGEGNLRDAARALSRYQDALDMDGDDLPQVEQRLDVVNRLLHKYARSVPAGEDPVEAVLAHRRSVGAKLAELESDTVTLDGLAERMARLQRQLGELGGKLSRTRSQAAKRLKALVESQFRELEMPDATLDIELQRRDASDPQVDSSGLDAVEFLVRTNPGQDRLPLRKIASGGEISRIMLAIKTILADKDDIGVLVFDEIDANIGDRLGSTIGRKMQALARGAGASGGAARQLICITHLSQIAAAADHHLGISKVVVGSGASRQTVAQVRVLTGEQRAAELAAMMAGASATAATLMHARSLLERAGAVAGL